MQETLCLPARYRGPARSANGGYAAGSLAHELGDTFGRAVTVTLRQPPPLDATMHVTATHDGADLTFGGALVAQARWSPQQVEPVEAVSHDQAVEASTTYPGLRRHPFPTCFVCSPEREDGLRIQPGEVSAAADGSTRVAAPWTPDESLFADYHEYAGPSLRACLAATWAALDCAGAWAGDLDERPLVLGRMTAVVDELPVIGEPHVVMGQRTGDEGRKTFSATTIYDADERILARAEHVWLTVDPAAFKG